MEISNPTNLIAVLISFLLLIAVTILIERRRTKKRIRQVMQNISDLGFVVDENPDPRHVRQLISLRPGTRPSGILKKRMGNATMYAYMQIIDHPGIPQFTGYYETVAIVSSNLNLPRFTISPAMKNLDRMKPKDIEEIDKSKEFTNAWRVVERIQPGLDEGFEKNASHSKFAKG
jgi:hypothetical protein